MSGGGSRGAFEAGALWGIYYTDKDKKAMEYDVVTGVSVGAVNTGLVGVVEKGREEFMVHYLSMAWQNLTNDNIWKVWAPGGIRGWTNGLLKESGVMND